MRIIVNVGIVGIREEREYTIDAIFLNYYLDLYIFMLFSSLIIFFFIFIKLNNHFIICNSEEFLDFYYFSLAFDQFIQKFVSKCLQLIDFPFSILKDMLFSLMMLSNGLSKFFKHR